MRCRALGLWEVTCGMVALVVLAGTIQGAFSGRIDRARVARTHQEMASLLEAGRQYAALHGAWPAWPQLLEVLPQASRCNVWGKEYVVGVDGHQMWIETLLWQDGAWAKVRVSTGKPYGSAARLAYEQRRGRGL